MDVSGRLLSIKQYRVISSRNCRPAGVEYGMPSNKLTARYYISDAKTASQKQLFFSSICMLSRVFKIHAEGIETDCNL